MCFNAICDLLSITGNQGRPRLEVCPHLPVHLLVCVLVYRYLQMHQKSINTLDTLCTSTHTHRTLQSVHGLSILYIPLQTWTHFYANYYFLVITGTVDIHSWRCVYVLPVDLHVCVLVYRLQVTHTTLELHVILECITDK